jgi:hypothetical protein
MTNRRLANGGFDPGLLVGDDGPLHGESETGETVFDRRPGGILAVARGAPVAGRQDEGAPPDARTRVGRRHFLPVATTIR